MNSINSCQHLWEEVVVFSKFAHKIQCNKCFTIKVAKPRIYIDPLEFPFAANEFIAYKLIELLKYKGLQINSPKAELYNCNKRFYNYNFQSLWNHGVVIIDYVGDHSRITDLSIGEIDLNYPDWLYYFDRWIGRIDGNGDSNLLLVNNEIIPIDYNLSFCWNNTLPERLIKIDDLDVSCHYKIKKSKNDNVRRIIKSLSDAEIFNTISSISKDFISTQGLIAYYTGLCFRRDLL